MNTKDRLLYEKSYREKLPDAYIIIVLTKQGYLRENITPELIIEKREQIKEKRERKPNSKYLQKKNNKSFSLQRESEN